MNSSQIALTAGFGLLLIAIVFIAIRRAKAAGKFDLFMLIDKYIVHNRLGFMNMLLFACHIIENIVATSGHVEMDSGGLLQGLVAHIAISGVSIVLGMSIFDQLAEAVYTSAMRGTDRPPFYIIIKEWVDFFVTLFAAVVFPWLTLGANLFYHSMIKVNISAYDYFAPFDFTGVVESTSGEIVLHGIEHNSIFISFMLIYVHYFLIVAIAIKSSDVIIAEMRKNKKNKPSQFKENKEEKKEGSKTKQGTIVKNFFDNGVVLFAHKWLPQFLENGNSASRVIGSISEVDKQDLASKYKSFFFKKKDKEDLPVMYTEEIIKTITQNETRFSMFLLSMLKVVGETYPEALKYDHEKCKDLISSSITVAINCGIK